MCPVLVETFDFGTEVFVESFNRPVGSKCLWNAWLKDGVRKTYVEIVLNTFQWICVQYFYFENNISNAFYIQSDECTSCNGKVIGFCVVILTTNLLRFKHYHNFIKDHRIRTVHSCKNYTNTGKAKCLSVVEYSSEYLHNLHGITKKMFSEEINWRKM